MRDERTRFIGTRPYRNSHCLSGMARRSCDNNCSPSTVPLTCMINRNWGWTGGWWGVTARWTLTYKYLAPNQLLEVHSKVLFEKASCTNSNPLGPMEKHEGENQPLQEARLYQATVNTWRQPSERTFKKSSNFWGVSRTMSFLIRSLGRLRSALVNCPGPIQWLNLRGPHGELCIPAAASMMIKSLEPSGTNASASVRAVSGCLKKVRNRCPSMIAKYWRHLSIGGKFSFDTLNAALSSSVRWFLYIRLDLIGLMGSTPSNFLRGPRRLTGVVTSLDEERIDVSEKKRRRKERGSVCDRFFGLQLHGRRTLKRWELAIKDESRDLGKKNLKRVVAP